ncbi:MAG: MFS transporter [Betaproteobacteria bacterium]|nr:MFS transporter [Betaproteobacteria bacterium]
MKSLDYVLFLVSQALSELGDNLWSLGLRNFLFDNSPWTPAAGLAAVFLLQAIPVFFFGPWISAKIGHRWRAWALWADLGRMAVTLVFAVFVYFSGHILGSNALVFTLLLAQLLLEFGALIFQNCRNCLVPILYPNPNDIPRAHLWANVASLSAAGLVPLIFLLALPAQHKIQTDWLMWAALIDAISFGISATALFAIRRSQSIKEAEAGVKSSEQKATFLSQFAAGLKVARKHRGVARLLLFSFFYNIFLMGPFEIGHVTFLRRDLGLPPAALAVNLLLFLGGISVGTFAANWLWRSGEAPHFRRFASSVLWDGLTFFPICLFAFLRGKIPDSVFLAGLSALFLFHYAMVPFVKVSRLAGIQTQTDRSEWSVLLSFHAVAVEGASAVSVIFVALVLPDVSGTLLLALGGAGATLCGLLGLGVFSQQVSPQA